MTNIIVAGNHAVHRPPLCRSDQQPNLLEYIDTTLNESFSLNLTFTRAVANGYDQFGNTILDQYLLYLVCQKINPNRTDHLSDDFYQLLHQLIVCKGKISKALFEYSPFNRAIFSSYTNFIWNELDVNVLLELGECIRLSLTSPSVCFLGCFLLKYRLRDLFAIGLQKIPGYFLEILVIYYLSSNHSEFFRNSRSMDMIFPSPSLYPFFSPIFTPNTQQTFQKFLQALDNNGEVHFDLRQIKLLLQSDAHQFVNKKLDNKKISFINFLSQQSKSCRSLKSLCRLLIKLQIKQFPNDIKQLSLFPAINDRLQQFLICENQFAFESFV